MSTSQYFKPIRTFLLGYIVDMYYDEAIQDVQKTLKDSDNEWKLWNEVKHVITNRLLEDGKLCEQYMKEQTCL